MMPSSLCCSFFSVSALCSRPAWVSVKVRPLIINAMSTRLPQDRDFVVYLVNIAPAGLADSCTHVPSEDLRLQGLLVLYVVRPPAQRIRPTETNVMTCEIFPCQAYTTCPDSLAPFQFPHLSCHIW